jgi:crossover junction endodeoxyribonuclease RuvC
MRTSTWTSRSCRRGEGDDAAAPLLILGIDPGTAVTGYGVVRADPRPALVECGVIRTKAETPLPERLREISEGVRELLARHRPDAMVILLAGAEANVPIHEYPPADIKKAVAGTGAATKTQVQFMLTKLLRLTRAPEPNDAADGVAAALTCALRAPLARALAARPVTSGIGGRKGR